MRYKLKIQIGNNEFNFGKGVVELLELCDKYGSLSKAYKEMGMSIQRLGKSSKEPKKIWVMNLFVRQVVEVMVEALA